MNPHAGTPKSRADTLEIEVRDLRCKVEILQQQLKSIQDAALAQEEARFDLQQRMVQSSSKRPGKRASMNLHDEDTDQELQRLRQTVATQVQQVETLQERMRQFEAWRGRRVAFERSISDEVERLDDQWQEMAICKYTSIPKLAHHEEQL
ncbi:hypothetical protein N7481_007493 [Penicillium waksmanii]|uniref:uncharacterized protein n=1 Tax=Penicillium waksmanii TaxID=69791 RepID=UPI0025499651|nr:uncharacterized protein N7481_007493 [Penicillium waksmanii]KAJ5980195.1 hypothetical protein N7481_007493 [Penicillium waksmanii]